MRDKALAGLGKKERQAVLVRYLQGKTAGETGAVLGISEAAVEKRLERGVAKLRGYFAKCGYVVTAGVVVGVMCGEAMAAAAALVGKIATRCRVVGVSLVMQQLHTEWLALAVGRWRRRALAVGRRRRRRAW